MARDPPYSTAKQRSVSHPYKRSGERPSAFDRFPGQARNKWLNEIQAKIDRTLNPPSSPGPSRSPSPIEEDGEPLGVAQVDDGLEYSGEGDELDDEEEEEEDEGYVSGEQEDDGEYDEYEEHEDLEDQNPLGFGSQVKVQDSEDGFYEDDDYDEDEDEYEERELPQPQLPFSAQQLHEPRLGHIDTPGSHTILPSSLKQSKVLEGEYDEYSEDLGSEEEDELEEDDHQEDEEDVEKENSITFIGDTDEEESQEEEDEEEEGEEGGVSSAEEDEEDVEDEEIDDDGMGGPDALPLEQESLESQVSYETVAPVGVEHGQVVYDYRTSHAEMDYLRDTQAGLETPTSTAIPGGFINPNQLSDAGIPQANGSGSSSFYPPLPTFDPAQFNTTPAFRPASQMVPPWEPSPLDPAIIAAEAMVAAEPVEDDLIDPSLLADFAQRVEAQASGDLGNTTEAQNTEEMTALADAVMDQYNDTPAQIFGTDSARLVQHGMGEAEEEGYEEDDGSRATSEESIMQDQNKAVLPVVAGDVEEDGSDEDSDSRDGSSSSAASPGIANTQDEPIEILSSDEEEDSASEESQADDQSADEEDSEDEDDEEEEEEEVERERPAGQHTRLDHDMADMLTPPHTSTASRSSGRSPIGAQPVSPTIRTLEAARAPELTAVAPEAEEVEDYYEDDVELEAEQPLEGGYPFSPMAVIESEAEVQPIVEEEPVEAPTVTAPTGDMPIESSLSIETPVAIETPIPIETPISISTETQAEAIVESRTDEIVEETVVEQQYEVQVEEPMSRGPSVPLATPAVELPLDSVFPEIPEAGLEAILRVLGQPVVVEDEDPAEESLPTGEEADLEIEIDTQIEVLEVEAGPGPAAEEVMVLLSDAAPAAAAVVSQGDSEVLADNVEPALVPLGQSPVPVSATDFATIETNIQLLPDPRAEPVETDLAMPEVPYHRSRTPSLIVEPPANPPNPDIVIEQPPDEIVPDLTEDLPDPQDPVPDTHIVAPLSPHDMRPTLERSPSLFVNVQEVEMMLDPGPNESREETPVEFPEHDQPAPATDLVAPIEPEDLTPRFEPRSVSMEALAPGEAPLEEMTGAQEDKEEDKEEAVLFPDPKEAAPNTFIPSPLDVRRDLPLEVEGSETAPSLMVEPPSAPVTGPPSLTGSGAEPLMTESTDDVQPDLTDVPEIVIEQEDVEEDEMDVPTSSNIDIPSAPLRATTPPNEAGPSQTQHIRFASPLLHHHGHAPRHTSVPPPATRATRRHTRQSSAAADALSPPVTRQNCHYRKLYMVEDDMSAVVLVPQCTLTDQDKLQEEHSEDRGDATPADEAEARHKPICEATPRLQMALTAKLHRIVGSDIFDEAQKTYLLSASDASLLPEHDVAEASTSAKALASVSPVKPRRSKRLSEAPSETSIAEEPTKHKSGVSTTKTASPVPEAEEAETEVEAEADVEGRYELRSKSEAPEEVEAAEETDTEIEAVQETQGSDDADIEIQASSSLTASPVSPAATTQAPTSRRYSLRSQPDIPEADEIVATESKRATTPAAGDDGVTQSQTTPMTTRRRARESIAPSPAPMSSGTNVGDVKTKGEPSTPRVKGKGKSKSPKKERRESDSRYIPNDEDDSEDDEKNIVKEETDRESSVEVIPYANVGTPSTAGRKKRKLGSSVGHLSPWQLERQDLGAGAGSEGSPSASGSRRSKKRAVENKDEPDTPVPVEIGQKKDDEDETPLLPQPKGWMSYIWPFKR